MHDTGGATDLLAGVRVIDLSQYIPGPYATRLMADLGADVIKIEPPGGEPMRTLMGGDVHTPSSLYTHLNRGKRVLFLDLKSNAGAAHFSDLVEKADVLLDGFRPGMLAKLGYDEATLNSLNRRLVHCGLSGFGGTGPYAQRAGHDLGYCAAAGILSYPRNDKGVDPEEYNPQIPFPPLADHVGSLQAVNAVLAALVKRNNTDKGCHLDVSLYESILSWYYFSEAPGVVDMLSGGAAYYNIYPTQDQKFVTLGAIETKFWTNFCQAVGKAEWIKRYNDPLPQVQLKAEVNANFRNKKLNEWVELLANTDCCFEPIPPKDSVFHHGQTQSRDLMRQKGGSYPAFIDHCASGKKPPHLEFEDPGRCMWHSVSDSSGR